MPPGSASSWAFTLRFSDGFTTDHETRLSAWLRKHATQWEFYEEFASSELSSRHMHGRVLCDKENRRDVVAKSVARALRLSSSEAANLARGGEGGRAISFLYSNWLATYCGTEDKFYSKRYEDLCHLTDESDWVYSTEADKKGPTGYNFNKDISDKAEAFIADMAGDGFHPSIDDVRSWYSTQCHLDRFKYHHVKATFRYKTENIFSRVQHMLRSEAFASDENSDY